MDPEISMRNLKAALARLNDQSSNVQPINPADVDNVIDAFNALDEWLTAGGYLPSEWASDWIRASDEIAALKSNYYTRNLDQLDSEDIKVKFVSAKGETHWLSISKETLTKFYPIFAELND